MQLEKNTALLVWQVLLSAFIPPDAVFIVNQENGVIPRARQNMPLNNKLSLQWGPVYLALGVSYQFVLSIGIANGEKMAKYQKSHQFFSIFLHFHFESR